MLFRSEPIFSHSRAIPVTAGDRCILGWYSFDRCMCTLAFGCCHTESTCSRSVLLSHWRFRNQAGSLHFFCTYFLSLAEMARTALGHCASCCSSGSGCCLGSFRCPCFGYGCCAWCCSCVAICIPAGLGGVGLLSLVHAAWLVG